MKKKLLTTILLSSLLFTMSACGRSSVDKTESQKESTATETPTAVDEVLETPTAETPSETIQEENTASESTLNDIVSYLQEKEVLQGEPTETFASMIGAIDGIKYADSGVEIYEFDMNSDAYKTLESGQPVGVEGMEGFEIEAAAINGKFVLILTSENQDAVNAFNEFK